MEALAILLGAAACALGAAAAVRRALRTRWRILLALEALRSDPAPHQPPEQRTAHNRSPLRAAMGRAGGALSLGPMRRWAERCLQGTGLPLRPEELLLLCALAPVAGYGLGAVFGLGALRWVLAPAGLLVPPLLCRQARGSRSHRLSIQLGELLLGLGNALRAGHSLPQALENASAPCGPPLGPEMQRLLREVAAGIPLDEALDRLVARTANSDLELLVTAIQVQRSVGGNLAEVLDNISGTIRARVEIKNHLRVVTAQSRLSGIVVSVLPLGVFGLTLLVAPQVERTLLTDPLGRILGVIAVVLELIGILAIRRIVAIRY